MNQTVRDYLIRKSKQKKTVGYSEINIDCNLNLDFTQQNSRTEIGRILGEISTFEFSNNRPLISSIVVYKSDKLGTGIGNGFYNLAEELGFGQSAHLKSKNFAETEIQRSFDFWSGESTHNIHFFTKFDLDDFREIAKTEYRKDSETSLSKSKIIKPIYQKTNYWGEQLKIEGFTFERDNRWQISGYFKSYAWIRIYKNEDRNKLIYFTIGIDRGEEHGKSRLFYKLDCQRENINQNNKLSVEQIEIFDNYVKGSGANWREIDYNSIEDYDWDSLIQITRGFIFEYQDLYEELIDLVWSNKLNLPKSSLILKERPNGSYAEYPQKEYSFKGIDKDYVAEQHKKHYIGNKGEKLVVNYEIDKLIKCDRRDLAEEVKKVKDGKGYDILSYDKKGNVIYIEVKTTKGNSNSVFYLTDNELEFMKRNKKLYKIYRVYNFKPILNSGEFYILTNVEDRIVKKPILYEVQLKRL